MHLQTMHQRGSSELCKGKKPACTIIQINLQCSDREDEDKEDKNWKLMKMRKLHKMRRNLKTGEKNGFRLVLMLNVNLWKEEQ